MNIALVNELKVIYAAMGIDIWEVIEAAKTKPFGFTPIQAGVGRSLHSNRSVLFGVESARIWQTHPRAHRRPARLTPLCPVHVANRSTDALNSKRKPLHGSKILLVGLAYKADVDDMRESPTFVLLDLLGTRGAEVAYYDPHIPVIGPTRRGDGDVRREGDARLGHRGVADGQVGERGRAGDRLRATAVEDRSAGCGGERTAIGEVPRESVRERGAVERARTEQEVPDDVDPATRSWCRTVLSVRLP